MIANSFVFSLRFALLIAFSVPLVIRANLVANDQTETGATNQHADLRGQQLKTLNGHFPLRVPPDKAGWSLRSAALRERVLVATGLWPMPEKAPLSPVIHGKIERQGFSVEKVYFESLPGHFVTGLLFRPTGRSNQKLPAVLSPHGHGGRLQRHSDQELAKQLASGAEHFEKSGRMPKLARCAQLARMGCVTFIFDMLGYADSNQISYEVGHRYKNVATDYQAKSSDDDWGFFSLQAELRLQSIMGLQTWNAIRSIDFLASLPDVDPERIAVTGGSGGGTQTILLGAIDDRVKVGFPNGMVSTSMQGGCYCENCNLLRIDTGNVELAALFAPKPQAMTAADDWTKAMMDDGYPELQQIYAMTGNQQDVYCRPMLHFKHNYNYVTRATMYQWMNRHLKLGLDDPVIEQDYEPLRDEEMAVWDQEHPAPKDAGFEHQSKVCRWFDQQATQQLASVIPKAEDSIESFQSVYGTAWSVIFDQGIPEEVRYTRLRVTNQAGLTIETGIVAVDDRATRLPTITVGKSGQTATKVLVWTDEVGKSVAFESTGEPAPQLLQFVNAGYSVVVPDLYHQGELAVAGVEDGNQPLIKDDRPYSAFTFCYNRSATVQRTADLLAIIAHAKSTHPQSLRLLATRSAGLWAAPAAMQASDMIDRFAIADGSVRFADARSYADVRFVPGAIKYGDLPALLALSAPQHLTVIADSEPPSIVRNAYRAVGFANRLEWTRASNRDDQLSTWIESE